MKRFTPQFLFALLLLGCSGANDETYIPDHVDEPIPLNAEDTMTAPAPPPIPEN